LEADELGQASITLPIEVGIAVLLLGETLPAALAAGIVVEGVLLLPTGIAYIQERLSSQSGTYDVRPVEVPQGLAMGDGTNYVVTVNDSATTIQVLSGSVIFVDRYTNNSVTIEPNQMLTLPSGQLNGFSEQDLQSDLSSFNTASINEWWAPTTTSSSSLTDIVLGFFVIAIIIAVVGIAAAVAVRGRNRRKRAEALTLPPRSPLSSPTLKQSQPVVTPQVRQPVVTPQVPVGPSVVAPANKGFLFCPNCGKQLTVSKNFCPFCGFELRPKYSNA
jgi:hypothetical protein